MDQTAISLAGQLQRKLDAMDPQRDRDTLVWAHGFLTAMVHHIESSVPDLRQGAGSNERSASLREASQALLAALRERLHDPDSLGRIGSELDDSDEACTPVTKKPGPKGLIGGAALPLPEGDLPM